MCTGFQRRDGDVAVGVGHCADAEQIEIRDSEEFAIICGGMGLGKLLCGGGEARGIEIAEAGDFYGAFQTTICVKVHLSHGSAADNAGAQGAHRFGFAGFTHYVLLSLITDTNPHIL